MGKNMPAYPVTAEQKNAANAGSGKTLRDSFAEAALTGILSKGDYDPEGAAEDAYKFADAMLAQRKDV